MFKNWKVVSLVMASNKSTSRGKSLLGHGYQSIVSPDLNTYGFTSENEPHSIDAIQTKQEETDWKLAQKLQQVEDTEQMRRLYALQFESEDSHLLIEEEEEEEDSDEEEVQWIASHLNPNKIIWSSNPKVITI